MATQTLPGASINAPVTYSRAEKKGLPFFGTFINFVRDPLAYVTRMRERGDLVTTTVMGRHLHVASHPDLIEQVLVTHSAHFRKDAGLRSLTGIFGNGLLTSDGDFWLRQRRMASPAFHRQRIAAFGDIMVTQTAGMLQTWQPGEIRDLHDDMMHLTLDVVARCLFSVDTAGQAGQIGRALDAIMAMLNNQGVLKLLKGMLRIRTQANRDFESAIKTLDAVIYAIIRDRQQTRRDNGDLLSLFLAARDEDGSGMNEKQLHDECMTMFVAGHETTALALTWTWYELARHPQVARHLRKELARVLNGRAPALEDLPALTYTSQIITESMRLHPPAWVISREAIADVEIGGCRIAAGEEVMMSQYAMHRDPRYFPEPGQFRPERWEGDFAKTLPKIRLLSIWRRAAHLHRAAVCPDGGDSDVGRHGADI